MKHYQDDPLASDSEDEKNLGRAEKEARKDAECQASKRRCGKQVTASKRPRRGQGFDQPGTNASEPPATSSGAMPPSRHPRAVPGPLGPCWRCGAFGHLAASCTAAKSYPLSQPVVSSAEVSTVDKVELSLYVGGVNGVAAEPGTSNNCTVKLKASDQGVWYEGTDEQSASSANSNFLSHDELDTSDNLTKFWEAGGSTPVQISDVQGHLKQKLSFWKEVLQAPPPVLEHGYRLPLKCIPNHFLNRTISQLECTTCLCRRQSLAYLKSDVCKRCTIKLMYVAHFLLFLTQQVN